MFGLGAPEGRLEQHRRDERPSGPHLKDKIETNWELSALRASTVVRYLVDTLSLDPAHIQAVGDIVGSGPLPTMPRMTGE